MWILIGIQIISHQLGGKEAQANNDLVKFINEHQQIQLKAELLSRE